MRIVVTGSRDWRKPAVIHQAIDEALSDSSDLTATLTHGACPTGADAIADRYAQRAGLSVIKYEANWAKLGRRAGPWRNHRMMQDAFAVQRLLGEEVVVLAFRRRNSAGTTSAIREAEIAGLTVRTWEDE